MEPELKRRSFGIGTKEPEGHFVPESLVARQDKKDSRKAAP